MHDRRSECSAHGGFKCTFMGLSFASADTFRRSLIENCMLLPQVMSKRGGPGDAITGTPSGHFTREAQFLGGFQVGWRYNFEGKSTGRRHIGAESAEKERVFPGIR